MQVLRSCHPEAADRSSRKSFKSLFIRRSRSRYKGSGSPILSAIHITSRGYSLFQSGHAAEAL